MSNKITHEEFVTRAIESLKGPKYKGIHAVFSGFNAGFRKYFQEDPVEVTKMLAAQVIIETRPARGGVMLYLPGEGPESRRENVLAKILEKDPSEEAIPCQDDPCINGPTAPQGSRGTSKWVIVIAVPVHFDEKEVDAEPRGDV